MTANPFSLPPAPPWLTENPTQQVPRLLERLLDVAEAVPELYTELPWLREVQVWDVLQERVSALIFDAPAPGEVETILTAFFGGVTRPIAELVEALYTAPLLRDRRTVGEIMRRMAQAAGQASLPQEVISGLCASCFWRRVEQVGREPIRRQPATWQIHWQPTGVRLHSPAGSQPAFVVLVTEQATGRVLAMRCTREVPSATDLQLALYDALVFPGATGRYLVWYLAPPTQLLVQAPLPPAIGRAARLWRIEAHEMAPLGCALLQEVEREVGARTLEEVAFLRILDRACERTYGYAPFHAKQRAHRRLGQHAPEDSDPLGRCLGLRHLLPAYPAVIGDEGTVEWQGWHYREPEHEILRYFAQVPVTLRPSPLSEALVAVDWNGSILCCAVADELRHADGSYRPYWFPYPRLGE